ncbi:MAG: hypothetical protein KFF73_06680 [Cyclobacteriaceae bacterium]|nr:hypothetical protein [Cyclobacteriaceae bacterium]
MDKLEKFIREKRASFDDLTPPDSTWRKINGRLDSEGRQVFLTRHMWKAATVLLFAAVIWLMVDRQDQQDPLNLSQIETSEGIDLRQVENYYVNLIENKQHEIRNFIDVYPEADEQLLSDVYKLDSSYQELKKKLLQGPNEKIIDAMVINLQTRIEILNQQLNVLEHIKQLKEENDETSKI